MAAFKDKLKSWLNGNSGATAIEYSLIAAGIALAIAATVYAFGGTLYDVMYSRLPEAFD